MFLLGVCVVMSCVFCIVLLLPDCVCCLLSVLLLLVFSCMCLLLVSGLPLLELSCLKLLFFYGVLCFFLCRLARVCFCVLHHLVSSCLSLLCQVLVASPCVAVSLLVSSHIGCFLYVMLLLACGRDTLCVMLGPAALLIVFVISCVCCLVVAFLDCGDSSLRVLLCLASSCLCLRSRVSSCLCCLLLLASVWFLLLVYFAGNVVCHCLFCVACVFCFFLLLPGCGCYPQGVLLCLVSSCLWFLLLDYACLCEVLLLVSFCFFLIRCLAASCLGVLLHLACSRLCVSLFIANVSWLCLLVLVCVYCGCLPVCLASSFFVLASS